MLDLNDFYYFVQVVDRGGFTAAGRAVRLAKSTLSHRIQELERRLGVRLLNRTSRQFGLTDAGSEFYRHAIGLLEQAENAESSIQQRLSEPSGTVRFTTGVATGQFAMKSLVAKFMEKYPKINLVEHAVDRPVDIVAENFDMAIRAHSAPLPNSTLLQRTLAPAPWFLFGGSDYLKSQKRIRQPSDLLQHPTLFMMRAGLTPMWEMRKAVSKRGKRISLPLTPRFLSDDMVTLKEAAGAGLGIVALPGYVCRDDVRSGKLQRVLPNWQAGDSTITALMPHRRGLLPSVRVFIEYLAAEFPKVVNF